MNRALDKENKRKRHAQISGVLAEKGAVTISEIASRFHITPATARKDLKELEAAGLAVRYHGGARFQVQNEFKEGPPLQRRLCDNITKKDALCRAALQLVRPGDSVILDSGSTIYLLAQKLVNIPHIVVVTSSLPVATLMVEHNIRVMVIGGEIFEADCSVGGPWVDACLNNVNTDIAFIGATNIRNPLGPEVENLTAGKVKHAMMQHAKIKYQLADSSKVFSSSLLAFSRWESLDGIIVDKDISPEFTDMIGSRTNIIYAE